MPIPFVCIDDFRADDVQNRNSRRSIDIGTAGRFLFRIFGISCVLPFRDCDGVWWSVYVFLRACKGVGPLFGAKYV